MKIKGFTMRDEHLVIVSHQKNVQYPGDVPYRPGPFPEFTHEIVQKSVINPMHGLLRDLFRQMGLDIDNFDRPGWNPLGTIVKPGQHVLVKPNLVRHLHLSGGDYRTVVTHPSLVRATLDYVALALKGDGRITLGDAPVQSCDFQKVVERNSLKEIVADISKSWHVPVSLVDFRLWEVRIDQQHHMAGGNSLGGDPRGYEAVDLGSDSLLMPLCDQNNQFRVTSYDCDDMVRHHNCSVNEYLIPKTVLEADTVINLPKLKTHRKVGVTAALKNLVGINGFKDWLPHHRRGATEEGGDEYLHKSIFKGMQSNLFEKCSKSSGVKFNSLNSFIARVLRRLSLLAGKDDYEEGSWYGNDTLWRTVLDLNKVLIYADNKGQVCQRPQRNYLTIVDAVLAGEGEGPMMPDPVHCGMLIGGVNPAAVDAVAATLMGFDVDKIPLIKQVFCHANLPVARFTLGEIRVGSNNPLWNGGLGEIARASFQFTPSRGWRNHIEMSVK
ncbi:MAG: DUF362 domain-containing protein [Thermodesulfobacteriota bacterium]